MIPRYKMYGKNERKIVGLSSGATTKLVEVKYNIAPQIAWLLFFKKDFENK